MVELTAEQEDFLQQCEEEFKNRFSEKDEDFMKVNAGESKKPPIIDPWYNTQQSSRNNSSRRNHGRDRRNRDHRDRDRDRGRGDRDRYSDRDRYGERYGERDRSDRDREGRHGFRQHRNYRPY